MRRSVLAPRKSSSRDFCVIRQLLDSRARIHHNWVTNLFLMSLQRASKWQKSAFGLLYVIFCKNQKLRFGRSRCILGQFLTRNSENYTNFTPICLFLAQTLKFSFLRSVSTNDIYCCLTIKIRSKSRKIKITVNCVLGIFKVPNRYFELNSGVLSRFEQNKNFRFFGEN